MKKFFLLYASLSIAVIAVKLLELDYLESFLKPLLMPSLIVFYILFKKTFQLYDYKILFALIFSTIGDILLMPNVNLFMGGIFGFLIAHIFYISAFLSENKVKTSTFSNWKKFVFIAGVIVYFSLLYLLFPKLDSWILKAAIFLYASILLSLLWVSLIRNPENSKSSDYVVLGAFLFMLSDGMIAINKFLFELHLSSLLIMGTYTIAQAFLVFGSLIRNRKIDSKLLKSS